MVKMTGTYDGNKKCSMKHEEGATLKTDAPKDIGGEASAFSPTDLLGASLGSCVLTTMAMFAERRNIDLTGARFEVQKEMIKEPERRVGKLPIKIFLPASKVPQEMRETLERVGQTCPVKKSLNPEIDIPIEYVYE